MLLFSVYDKVFPGRNILDQIHSKLPVHKGFRPLRAGHGPWLQLYECRYISFNFIKGMHLDAGFSMSELCPPEDIQAKINSRRVKSINLAVYLKIFVDSLLSCNINHVISKVFKNLRFPPFINLCKIASRYVPAKSKMVSLAGVGRNNIDQVTEAVSIAQLPEHHYKQLIPASKMLYVFITFVFHYNSVKNPLGKKLYKLREYIYFPVFIE